MATKSYNGYKNWAQWNVSLWINNDEGLYRMALDCVKQNPGNRDKAAKALQELLPAQTPDGAKYSKSAIRAAMVGM